MGRIWSRVSPASNVRQGDPDGGQEASGGVLLGGDDDGPAHQLVHPQGEVRSRNRIQQVEVLPGLEDRLKVDYRNPQLPHHAENLAPLRLALAREGGVEEDILGREVDEVEPSSPAGNRVAR